MERGYIKLWRKSQDSAIFKNPKVWLLWSYCLLKATHKERAILIGTQEVKLAPGQFVFGRKVAAEETGLSQQNVRTCLKILKKVKNLTIKSTNKFSIITIINWDTYQPDKATTNQRSNQQVTSSQPASNQQVTTDKNVLRTEECIKNNIPPKKKKVQKKFIPPTAEDVINYFVENGYLGTKGREAWEYYEEGGWTDSRGKKVLNWKQKMRGVWFKPENEISSNMQKMHNGRMPMTRSDRNAAACQRACDIVMARDDY